MGREESGGDRRWHRWHELKRHELLDLARDGLVVVPLGAIEQHGPFLPTGTDIMLATRAVEGALDRAALGIDRPLILASFLGIGCSAHHLPFGGTISLPPGLMIDVLVSAMLSIAESGVSRIALVNGHGGNTGVCHAAASEAASRSDLTVAALDYWEESPPTDPPSPGHAGRFETSLMLATRPELVSARREREGRDGAPQPGRGVYARAMWQGVDGFTDRPAEADADAGAEMLADIERSLAGRLLALARSLP